jgi:fumarate hydratase class II
MSVANPSSSSFHENPNDDVNSSQAKSTVFPQGFKPISRRAQKAKELSSGFSKNIFIAQRRAFVYFLFSHH